MQQDYDPAKIIDFKQHLKNPILKGTYQAWGPLVESILGVPSFNESYHRLEKAFAKNPNSIFFEEALQATSTGYNVPEEDLAKIPTEGPVIAVANHAFGCLDGIILGDILTSARSDTKLLVNQLLTIMPKIRPWVMQVDVLPGDLPEAAKRKNLKALKEVYSHLENQGCLGVFPSGTVTRFHLRHRHLYEPEWSPHVARFIRKSKATVLPVYFSGRNSLLFQSLFFSPTLRTACLLREINNKKGKTIQVRIGQPISYNKLESFEDDQSLMQFLRMNTYVLRNRCEIKKKKFSPIKKIQKAPKARKFEPIAEPIKTEKLIAEVEKLGEDQKLIQQGPNRVYLAKAEQIPLILQEIGRLREISFREVDEGTGHSRDLDFFDNHYQHLFIWHEDNKELVGAYRLGFTDNILPIHGKHGLYTTTLFKFRSKFLQHLDPAIEVGRSFVVPKYQRRGSALFLLLRGIGQFIVKNPRYKTLFGPVSINPKYHGFSKDLMVQFLKQNHSSPELAKYVKAKTPPKTKHLKKMEKQSLENSVRDIDDISSLIAEIEPIQKSVPPLLRQYIKLNGKMLSFNVDHDFGRCIDGLILVDLTGTDFKILSKFLGSEGILEFLKYHNEE